MANDWHPCLCQKVRFDLAGTDEHRDRAIKAFPKKYADMLGDTTPDDAGWVYIDPDNMCQQETKSIFAPGHDARMAGVAGWAIAFDAQMTDREGSKSADPGVMIEDLASTALREKAEFIAENLLASKTRKKANSDEKAKPAKTEAKSETEAKKSDPEPTKVPKMRAKLKANGQIKEGFRQANGDFVYGVEGGKGAKVVPAGEWSEVVAVEA